VVTFDVDQLIDYRGRRPAMTFQSTGWTEFDEPVLAVDLVRDATGRPFLLLHGAEPDLQWERFSAAVIAIVEDLGVQTTIGVHGIPMGVPHTRPTTVTAHGTRLELRLGQRGHDALGFAANVPHYLAQMEYPQAAAELIRQIARRAGLRLPVGELDAAAREITAAIDTQVAESDEVSAVVRALEHQFDAFARSADRTSLLAEPTRLPTADELGAEFEAFLAEQTRGERREDGPSA
jgi:hypothetical protein